MSRRSVRAGNPWHLFTFVFFIIGSTLIARHCYPDERIVQQSQHQYWRKVNLKATRGIIQDVRGNALVISDTLPSFAVDPSMLTSKDVEELSALIEDGNTLEKLKHQAGTRSRFLWIKRKADEAEAEKFRELKKNISGLFIINEQYRRYTNQGLMSHVLGFCDLDNRGIAGIEQTWDNVLYSPPGQRTVVRRQGSQPASLLEQEPEHRTVTPVVTLTLDTRIQYVVEKHLFKAAVDNGAKWAECVCMNPINGEILAMASYPTFDPSNRRDLNIEALSNGVISRGYEPGSTFKPIYMGIALERGWVTTDEIFFCPARLKVADGYIKESSPVSMGYIDTEQLLIKSSNVGMAQIGIRADKSKVYECLLALGFGQESDIELPGASKGILPYPDNWRGVVPANIAIGHGLAVTPLQLITAMTPIVNGGKLISPYIVKEAMNSSGEIVYKGQPEVLREVFTSETTEWIRAAMRNVVLEGTGKRAATHVTNLAGKTGTAQVPEGGKYSETRYVASFIGFWPYEDPKYLMLLVIGEPSSGRIYGGELAAPPFKAIVEEMAELDYYS